MAHLDRCLYFVLAGNGNNLYGYNCPVGLLVQTCSRGSINHQIINTAVALCSVCISCSICSLQSHTVLTLFTFLNFNQIFSFHCSFTKIDLFVVLNAALSLLVVHFVQ